MADHHGKEGGESKPERHIADALAWTESWGLHGGVGGVVGLRTLNLPGP